MRYKREKSCSPNGIQSFIDEITEGILSDSDLNVLKNNVLKRLKLCINDRLYEQQFIETKEDDEFIQDHLNIIKIYYDFYQKLSQYFILIAVFIFTKKGNLKKKKYNKNFKNSIVLELENGDILYFTDVKRKSSYLQDLDFSKNFCTSYNSEILNRYSIDWENNDYIREFQREIEEKVKLK